MAPYYPMEPVVVIIAAGISTLTLYGFYAIGLLGPRGTAIAANSLRIFFYLALWAAIFWGIWAAWR